MITEERLRELVKDNKPIYIASSDNGINVPRIDKYDALDLATLMLSSHGKQLYETKSDWEFDRDFRNITKTETLKLPTWEEAQKKLEVEICAPKGRKYLLQTKIITGYSCERENPYIIRIDRIGYADSQIDFEYTKENYIKACRLAKKLFLGEEV